LIERSRKIRTSFRKRLAHIEKVFLNFFFVRKGNSESYLLSNFLHIFMSLILTNDDLLYKE